MKNIFLVVLLLSATVFAQEKFEIKGASKNYYVMVEVEQCDSNFCKGKAKVSIYKKGLHNPFQVIKLVNTEFMSEESKLPKAKKMYDYQSVVFFEDYNFDKAEDLAIRDGNNGGYGFPSYQIYLFSPITKRFVLSPSLTVLVQGKYLGMFQINRQKKVLETFSKSGCCWHQTQRFRVVQNRPKKIYELTDGAETDDGNRYLITKKLINGRWRTWTKPK